MLEKPLGALVERKLFRRMGRLTERRMLCLISLTALHAKTTPGNRGFYTVTAETSDSVHNMKQNSPRNPLKTNAGGERKPLDFCVSILPMSKENYKSTVGNTTGVARALLDTLL